MKIDYSLSNNQGIEDVRSVIDLAVRAEELGFDAVWASEHVFNVSYVYERIGDKPYYEPLSILTYVAALSNISSGSSPKEYRLWLWVLPMAALSETAISDGSRPAATVCSFR